MRQQLRPGCSSVDDADENSVSWECRTVLTVSKGNCFFHSTPCLPLSFCAPVSRGELLTGIFPYHSVRHPLQERNDVLKVVIIDGNAISRGLLGTILENGGHQVVGGTNTSAAGLARMAKLHPQVVCVDCSEAEEGLALLDAVRTELPRTLLFLVSGKIDQATVQEALARGVHGFIVKPFNADTVLKTIRATVLKVARQHRAQAAPAPGAES
jgi:CheY-like chemotaxis protein